MKRLLYIVILLAVLCACDKGQKNVLSASKMEDVLYDYHIAQAMLSQMRQDSAQKVCDDYLNAVFKKHNVTEEEFDSSIVYYNRNSTELMKIYNNLDTRFADANEKAQLLTGNNDMITLLSNGGDTTNIWNGPKILLLRNKDILCTESFTILADTSFHKSDQFMLTFTPSFIKENKEDRDITLNVGFRVGYKDGKSSVITRQISYNGVQSLTIKADEEAGIENISGYFYYYGKEKRRNLCVISNVSLIRMHINEAPVPETEADSVKADSIKADTLMKEPVKRMTPEEIRLQNSQGKTLKIQTAPTIRRPNSIGPRRRTNKNAPASPQRRQ